MWALPTRYEVKSSSYFPSDSCLNKNFKKRFFITARKFTKKICSTVIALIYFLSTSFFYLPSAFNMYGFIVCQPAGFFLYVFLVCNLSNAQFRHHTQNCAHTLTHTHARSLTRSQNTKTYCVCRMCPNLWVTWVVKSFASSVHFALSLFISSSLCIWAAMSCFVIVIYLFSFSPLLYAWDVPKMAEKKLYLISHGLHFNFRVGFFLRQTEHNFEVDFLSVAMLRYNDFMGQERKV